ncbi:hypothetical protein [Corynebacterium sp. HMSC071F07]|uniref:hypothetical protein n=1 Tax=Corynebacterium sp. HMSC071F07 TaxID=1715203 RepID=UPI001AF006F1
MALSLPFILADNSIPHGGEVDTAVEVRTYNTTDGGKQDGQHRGPQAKVDEKAKTRPATMPSVE